LRLLRWFPANTGTGATHWVFARHIPASTRISKIIGGKHTHVGLSLRAQTDDMRAQPGAVA
jgi:hypothetical protein